MNSIINIEQLQFPWQTKDPFLFCVFHKDDYPRGKEDLSPDADLSGRNIGNDFTLKDGWRMYHGDHIPGFPAHPHRGFETITIVQEGIIDHSDSLGAAARFGHGDVQWMTAGKGVMHSEMFPMLQQNQGNPTDFFQIWLNLPSRSKFTDPHFAMLWNDTIPTVEIEQPKGNVKIRVIAGNYDGNSAPSPPPDSWAASSDNQVQIWTIDMSAGTQFILPSISKANRSLYFFEGETINIDDQNINHGNMIELSNEAIEITNGDKPSRLLLLEGKPIQEPVASYGPFVMNTQREIMDAIEEYNQTQFGGWPWGKLDHVHDKGKQRFAKFPDGRLEEPDR